MASPSLKWDPCFYGESKVTFLTLNKRRKKLIFIVYCLNIMKVCTSEDACRYARVSELFVYEKFNRVPAETVEAGDICAVCGIDDIQVNI